MWGLDLLKYKLKKILFENVIIRSPNKSFSWSKQTALFRHCLALAIGKWINNIKVITSMDIFKDLMLDVNIKEKF